MANILKNIWTLSIIAALLSVGGITLLKIEIVTEARALNPCDSADTSYDYNSSGSYTSQWNQCNEWYFPKDKSGSSDFSYSNPSQKPGNNAQDIIESNLPAMPTSDPNLNLDGELATQIPTYDMPREEVEQYLRQNFVNLDRYLSTIPPQLQQVTYLQLIQEYQRQLSNSPAENRIEFINWLEGLMTPRIAENVIPYLIPGQSIYNSNTGNGISNIFPNEGSDSTQSTNEVESILDKADQWIKRGNQIASCGIGDLDCIISSP